MKPSESVGEAEHDPSLAAPIGATRRESVGTMARILLVTTHPNQIGTFRRLRELSDAAAVKQHRLVEDPDEADLILFVASAVFDPLLNQMRRHPLLEQYMEKTRVFCESDYAIPFLSGVYTSIEKPWYNARLHRSGPYLAMYQNPYVTEQVATGDEPYLFSFIGDSQTHPCRAKLLSVRSDRGYLEDTHDIGRQVRANPDQHDPEAFNAAYAQIIHDSKFVLCPRGAGVSSVRLFDVMKSGRVPVIISDNWVPPTGPDWDKCSIRVAQRDISRIPAILREREDAFLPMAAEAKSAYDKWFADDILFNNIVDWCLATQPTTRWYNASAVRAILSRKHFKRYARSRIKPRIKQLLRT